MNKLPVLFVSCNADNLKAQEQASSGPARMIWGKRYDSVVVISTSTELGAPEILHPSGAGASAAKIQSLLQDQGLTPEVCVVDNSPHQSLLTVFLSEEPREFAELRLNTGMSEREYRRVGQCLEVLREQGVLVICLDDKTSREGDHNVSLHDHHLREMINGWVQDQQWGSVMSFKGNTAPQATSTMCLDDPTVCLLNAAFTLGGSQFPQRMFSSRMNNAAQMLSGFGWMR